MLHVGISPSVPQLTSVLVTQAAYKARERAQEAEKHAKAMQHAKVGIQDSGLLWVLEPAGTGP